MKNRLSWKWKLLIAFIVLLIFSFGFVLSSTGMNTIKGWIDTSYNNCPPEVRVSHPSADGFLTLAWWEGYILGKEKESLNLYREFLGILPGKEEGFWEHYNSDGEAVWNGKFDCKTKTGWGILH